MNKVELLFKNKAAIDRGTYFLLKKPEALEFINECAKNNIGILGIDGFYKIDMETIQPSMENSVDYSIEPMPNLKVYEEAAKFLKTKSDDLFFEIVCAD